MTVSQASAVNNQINTRGSAIIFVLIITLVLSYLAASTLSVSITDEQLAANMHHAHQAYYHTQSELNGQYLFINDEIDNDAGLKLDVALNSVDAILLDTIYSIDNSIVTVSLEYTGLSNLPESSMGTFKGQNFNVNASSTSSSSKSASSQSIGIILPVPSS